MNTIYENIKTKTQPEIGQWFRRGILAWLTAAVVEYLLLPEAARSLSGLNGLAQMSGIRMILVFLSALMLLTALSLAKQSDGLERWALVGIFGLLMILSVGDNFSWPFLAVCSLILTVLAFYALSGWDSSELPKAAHGKPNKVFVWLTVAGTVGFFLLVSIWTACRVYSFSTPTYDFGIFSQMFHSMKTTGLPITTVERDGALSHFAVHMSPIYYLLLPFYALVPTPATLQVLQAAVLASAVIPLWKLGKHHGLSDLQRMILCFVLLLYPAYAGGTSYDIHENAFLAPLILWLFYGIDRKNGVITAVAALLTLMVKEDAAVYVAVIAVYLLLRALLSTDQKWGLVTGGILLAGSVFWFAAVTGYLASSGDGVMTYRYDNFIYDDSSSLLTVIKAVLLSPMKAVFECVDPEKLEFIALTLLPLAALPLLTRRYERFFLLIPYVLVNLMSDYQYQHDIFFQYTYGSTACLVYLTLVNLADVKCEKKRLAALGLALCIGAGCFGAQIIPKATRYPGYCTDFKEQYDQMRQTLDTIPEDASVAATTYLTTYLSQRDELYDVKYASREHLLSCEYVALSVTDTTSYKPYAEDGEKGFENFVALLTENGYSLYTEYEDRIEIYWKP